MGYDVFVRRFVGGDSSPAPFSEVAAILQKYGTIEESPFGGLQFLPTNDDICEIGFIDGDQDSGVAGIMFSRPRDKLPPIIFDLLGIQGMSYFEQDVIHLFARSDITTELPEGLAAASAAGRLTIISSASEIYPD